jgi:glycosyltransferase involved in cell wall biosynthesis
MDQTCIGGGSIEIGEPLSVIAAVSRTPPITGQGKAGDLLMRVLRDNSVPTLELDLSRYNKHNMSLWDALLRSMAVGFMARTISRARCPTSRAVFYLHLGQSTRSFMRDLVLMRAARRNGFPTVAHVHGGGFRRALDAAPNAVRAPLRRTLQDVSAAIVLTPRLKRMFEGILPPSRVFSVSNGIEGDVWRHSPPPRPRAAEEAFRVLFLSNLIPEKGYPVILQMAKIALTRNMPVEFTIAGGRLDGRPPPASVFDDARRLGNVRLVGPVDGRPKVEVLQNAHAFVLPTTYPVEGQPLVLLEAMHFGLPVISTSVGGIPDVVTDGVTGWLHSRPSPEDFLNSVDILLGDDQLRLRLGRNARARARTEFTAERHTDMLLSILKSAARSVAA